MAAQSTRHCYSEWLAVRKELLCPIPEGVDDLSAAGIPVTYLTAQVALTRAGFQAGKTVLAPAIGESGRQRGDAIGACAGRETRHVKRDQSCESGAGEGAGIQ
jgi:NADPH2:quinone reductase